MKLSNIIFLVTLSFSIINCTKENGTLNNKGLVEEEPKEPETVVYFTYTSTEGGSEHWIVIHDNLGKLIDYKQISDGLPVEFIAPKDSIPDKINITRFLYNKDAGNNQFHTIVTYTDINKSSIWEDSNKYKNGNLIGKFNFHIKNITDYESILISTPNGRLGAGDTSIEEISGNTNLNLIDIPLYEGLEYMISIKESNGGSKYFKLNPDNELTYSNEYNVFLEFDDYLELDLQQNIFTLFFSSGFKDIDSNTYWGGHVFSEIFGNSFTGLQKVGYLNGYVKYKTYLNINQGDFNYTSSIVGDKVQNIPIPNKPSLTIENSNIYDFKFSSELSPITKQTEHRSEKYDEQGAYLGTTWLVYSGGTSSQVVGELPIELIEKYPSLDLNNLELFLVHLSTQGFTQQEIFNQLTTQYRTGQYTTEEFRFTEF